MRSETIQLIDRLDGETDLLLRQAFAMTYSDGMPKEEACASLGVTMGVFKARLCRARNYLMNQAERSVVAPIHRAMYLPSLSAQKDFQALATRSAEIPSLEMACS
jgi:hypothetical protein